MPAGYSATPLIKKLGIKPGATVRFINEPVHYRRLLGPMPGDVALLATTRGPIDFIHLFAPNRAELSRRLPPAVRNLATNGMLWVSWPKKTSALATDIDEAFVRETGLSTGLVDVKICAVDQDWSGLKFVYRLKDRPT